MKYRMLGTALKVSAVGMGVMGFSHGYGALPPKDEAIRLIYLAHDLGCTHFDTADSDFAGVDASQREFHCPHPWYVGGRSAFMKIWALPI